MTTARRLLVAGLAGALALGAGACTVTAPPVMPMMTPPGSSAPATAGEDGDGGMMDDRGRGPMRRDATDDATPTRSGPIAGEGLDAATAAGLQAAVDRGSQPWRLDPGSVALAFARGHLGVMMPRVTSATDGTVALDDPAGHEASLRLTQPARAGAGGIWVVDGGTWVR